MSAQDEFEAFVDLVRQNLAKHGFPENVVTFPQDKLFESASRKGFSFNKVRDRLRTEGIESSLSGDKVVFTKQRPESGLDMASMASMAQSMLEHMDPKERERLLEYVKNMDPATMQEMQRRFENMSLEEKQRLWQQFQK